MNLTPIFEWLGLLLESENWKAIKPSTLWNVNTPDVNLLEGEKYKGVKFCKMGLVMYEDAYIKDEETEEWMLKGKKPASEKSDTDDYWLEQGYMTIVPLKIEQTDDSELEKLKAKFEI